MNRYHPNPAVERDGLQAAPAGSLALLGNIGMVGNIEMLGNIGMLGNLEGEIVGLVDGLHFAGHVVHEQVLSQRLRSCEVGFATAHL